MHLERLAVDAELTAAAGPTVPHAETPSVTVPDFATLFDVGEHLGTPYVPHGRDTCPTLVAPVGCEDCPDDELCDACCAAANGAGCDFCAGDAWDNTCERFEACGRCNATLSPRAAYLLHVGGEIFADRFHADVEAYDHAELSSSGIFDEVLPPAVLSWLTRQSPDAASTWLSAFLLAADTLTAVVAAGRVPRPNSTAQEMALRCIIAEAEAEPYLDLVVVDGFDGHWATLPAVDSRDRDLDRLDELLFEDDDVLYLFDPAYDGIDDPEDPVHQQLGMANLTAPNWFLPFDATAA